MDGWMDGWMDISGSAAPTRVVFCRFSRGAGSTTYGCWNVFGGVGHMKAVPWKFPGPAEAAKIAFWKFSGGAGFTKTVF